MMNSKIILLVEDNPQDEMLTLRALSRISPTHYESAVNYSQDELSTLRALHRAGLGNRVDVVRDGKQALDYLFQEGEFVGQQGAALPAVVLLDIGLPRLSGLEVLEQLRANTRTALLPVVILTSSDEQQDRLKSYENGANSFVRKPVNFADFSETVARLGIYWLAVNEPPPER